MVLRGFEEVRSLTRAQSELFWQLKFNIKRIAKHNGVCRRDLEGLVTVVWWTKLANVKFKWQSGTEKRKRQIYSLCRKIFHWIVRSYFSRFLALVSEVFGTEQRNDTFRNPDALESGTGPRTNSGTKVVSVISALIPMNGHAHLPTRSIGARCVLVYGRFRLTTYSGTNTQNQPKIEIPVRVRDDRYG